MAVALALGLSTLGTVRAERVQSDKIFKCSSGLACVQGIDSKPGSGIYGKAAAGAAVFGELTSKAYPSIASAAVNGSDLSGLAGNTGVYGYSSAGTGVYGFTGGSRPAVIGYSDSNSGTGVFGQIGPSGGSGFAVYSRVDTVPGKMFFGYGSFSGGGITEIDAGGNITTSGLIYTAGSCSVGCARTRDEDRRAVSYTPRESLPSMEDTGESRLVSGHAYVRIDAALANVIDRGAEFSVFITPEGDNRGLYVTQKSSHGFAVRESQAGRSTLSFAYRIVAKPYADVSSRLPMRTFSLHGMPSAPPDHRAPGLAQ